MEGGKKREEAKRRSGVERREASDAAVLSAIQILCLDRQMTFSEANYLQSGVTCTPVKTVKNSTLDVSNVGCIYRYCKCKKTLFFSPQSVTIKVKTTNFAGLGRLTFSKVRQTTLTNYLRLACAALTARLIAAQLQQSQVETLGSAE